MENDKKELIAEILNEVRPCNEICWVTETWLNNVLVNVQLPAKLTSNVRLTKIMDTEYDTFCHSEEELDVRMDYELELKAKCISDWKERHRLVLEKFAKKKEAIPYTGHRDYLDNVTNTLIFETIKEY